MRTVAGWPGVRTIWTEGRAVARANWYLRSASEVGSRVRLHGRPIVVNDGRMVVGDRVRMNSVVATLELVTAAGGELHIEDGAFINFGCSIAASKLIRIGAESQIGPHCMLLDNAFHHVEPELRTVRPESQPIILERNVWLGARCIVFPGVTIGADACVGAGSIVTKDVAPRTLVAGAPAKLIRQL